MALRIVLYCRDNEQVPLVEAELREIARLGRPASKDVARLEAVIKNCWRPHGFDCSQLEFRPIVGKPSEGKLWEAKWNRSARSDGVHGYRIFYERTRNPKTGEEVVVLLMVWGKQGADTPQAVLTEAWTRYLEVKQKIESGKFPFEPTTE